MRHLIIKSLCAGLVLVSLSACQTDSRQQLLKTSESQVALRSIQTRVFDTTDREETLRMAIATLQDLGFVIDKADADLGAVSATKRDRYMLRMTVTCGQGGRRKPWFGPTRNSGPGRSTIPSLTRISSRRSAGPCS